MVKIRNSTEKKIKELRERPPYYPYGVARKIVEVGHKPVLLGIANTWERYRFEDGVEVICTSYGQVWNDYDNWDEVLAAWEKAKAEGRGY